MALEILTFELGPMQNNTYLLADTVTGSAVVVDPSFDSEIVLGEAQKRGWTIQGIWLTHAHFDHIAGVKMLAESREPGLPVGLHPKDLPLFEQGGGARNFGVRVEPGPHPALYFEHEQTLNLGSEMVEVRFTPGHTPGHVVFYSASASAALVGDLIFYHSVGRTDLPGGDLEALLQSIHTQVMTLPPETRLLSGHGPETTVAEERENNPYL